MNHYFSWRAKRDIFYNWDLDRHPAALPSQYYVDLYQILATTLSAEVIEEE